MALWQRDNTVGHPVLPEDWSNEQAEALGENQADSRRTGRGLRRGAERAHGQCDATGDDAHQQWLQDDCHRGRRLCPERCCELPDAGREMRTRRDCAGCDSEWRDERLRPLLGD